MRARPCSSSTRTSGGRWPWPTMFTSCGTAASSPRARVRSLAQTRQSSCRTGWERHLRDRQERNRTILAVMPRARAKETLRRAQGSWRKTSTAVVHAWPLFNLAAEESRHQDRPENNKDAKHKEAKSRVGQPAPEDGSNPAAQDGRDDAGHGKEKRAPVQQTHLTEAEHHYQGRQGKADVDSLHEAVRLQSQRKHEWHERYDLRSGKAVDQAIEKTNRNLHRAFLAFS